MDVSARATGATPKKKGSATLYQLLAYGFLPATAFEEYEEAVRKRGDPSPPRAQGSLPILTLEQDLLESQEVLPRQDLLESQEVLPRQDLLESQEVLPRQDLLEPGSPTQTGPPKQHDVHATNDHASSTAKSEEEDVDRMIRQFILAAQKLAGIHNLFPKHLSEVRAYLLASGYDLEPQDCVYVLETVLSWLPEEAWAVESRIVGALNHNIKQFVAKACGEGVYVDPVVAREIRARMQERNAL